MSWSFWYSESNTFNTFNFKIVGLDVSVIHTDRISTVGMYFHAQLKMNLLYRWDILGVGVYNPTYGSIIYVPCGERVAHLLVPAQRLW